MKALKAFIKLFEASQRSVKIKISFKSTNEHVEESRCKKRLSENQLMFIEEYIHLVCNLTNAERGTVSYNWLCYEKRIQKKMRVVKP